MSDLDLCYMPGFLLQEQFRAGKLSPVELLEAQIRRAEAGKHGPVRPLSSSYDDQRAFQLARAIEESSPWLDCNQRRPLTNC